MKEKSSHIDNVEAMWETVFFSVEYKLCWERPILLSLYVCVQREMVAAYLVIIPL